MMVDVPPGSFVVTPETMYNEQRATHDAVMEIKGMLTPISKASGDHETRLRALERKVWAIGGAAAAIGAVAGVVSNLVGH